MNSDGVDFDTFLDDIETEIGGIRSNKLEQRRVENQDLNAFQKGLVGGFENTKAMAHGFAGMARSALGDKTGAHKSFRRYQRHSDNASTYHNRVDRFWSGDDETGAFGGVGNFGSYLANKTGELLPFMIEVALSGAAGAVAGSQTVPGVGPDDIVAAPTGAAGGVLTRLFGKRVLKELLDESAEQFVKKGMNKKAAREAAEQYVRSNIKTLAPQAMKTVSKRWGANAGVIAASSALEGGGMWGEGMQNGYDNPYSAMGLGLVSGASEVFLGNVPLGMRSFFKMPGIGTAVNRVAKSKGPKPAAGFLWDVVRNMGEEGTQEAFQEFLGSINAEINDPEYKITSKETFMQWAEASAAGALGGFVFGAPVSVNNAIARRVNKQSGENAEAVGDDPVDLMGGQASYPDIDAFTADDLARLDEDREAVRDSDPGRAAELDELYEKAGANLFAAFDEAEAAREMQEADIPVGESTGLEQEFHGPVDLDTDVSAIDEFAEENDRRASREQSRLDRIQHERIQKALDELDGAVPDEILEDFNSKHREELDELGEAVKSGLAGKVKERVNILKKKARTMKRRAVQKAKKQSDINSSQIDTKPEIAKNRNSQIEPVTQKEKIESNPDNPYMTMPIAVVKDHADTGVRLAKEAVDARKNELSYKKPEPSDKVVQRWFNGSKIYLKQSDLDGKRNMLPLYTAEGKRRVDQSIIRENVSSEKPAPYVVKDASGTVIGKRMQLPAAETIGHKSGKPFYIEQEGGETFTYGASPVVEKIENPLSVADGQEVNTDPSEAQKEAENYRKAHVKIDGMDVSIENPQGSTRRGKDASGKEWESEMKADYGYIRGTKGYDKDHVDVFIAPGYTGGADTVHVVNQIDPKSGKFDEHKVVFGATTTEQAEKLYLANYEAGWDGADSVVEMSVKDFREWVFGDAPAKGVLEMDRSSSPEANLSWWTAEGKKKLKTLRLSQVKVKRNDTGSRWLYSIGDDNFVPSPLQTKVKTGQHAEKERTDAIRYLESGAWARANSEADWKGYAAEKAETVEAELIDALPQPTADDLMDYTKFPGEHYAVSPNTAGIQLRGLNLEPMNGGRPLTVPYNGTIEDAEAMLKEMDLRALINERDASFRESVIFATDSAGATVWVFRVDPQTGALSSSRQSDMERGRAALKEAREQKPPKQIEQAERRAEERKSEDAELDELFGQLRDLRGRLSMGVDPEIAVIGTKIAAVYMKKGVRNFRDFAVGCRDHLGEDWNAFKKYLHSFWSGAMAANSEADFFDDLEDISFKDAKGIVDNLDEKEPNTDEKTGHENAKSTDQHPGANQGGDGERTPSRTGDGRTRSGNDDRVLEKESSEDGSIPAEQGNLDLFSQNSRRTGDGRSLEQPGHDAEAGRTGTGSAKLVPDGAGKLRDDSGRSGRSFKPRRTDGPATRLNQENFRILNPESLVGGGPKTKFARNQKAIETFQTVLGENRAPTEVEREAIASYIGWGSFGQELFNGSWDRPSPKEGWESQDQWLREHLGKDEWQSAQRSIINAHYTDPPTVAAMWEMVERLGFKGGRVLEPAMGIGNFFGLMPDHLSAKSELTGIELDKLTGGMAQVLYPQANIQIKGYEKSQTPDNFYDLVIGNWPFAADGPADRRYNKLSPTLHDYFFLKALDQVRPGGLVVGITSSGTMDKLGQRARLEMSKKANLVASFRLPTGAFGKYAGTAVVTDIIIFQKRDGGMRDNVPFWVNTTEMGTPTGPEIRVNQYYKENPGHVLGTLDYGSGTTQGRAGMIVNRPRGFERKLTELPQQVPAGIYRDREKADTKRYITNNTDDRINSVTIGDDGNLYVVQGERMTRLEDTIRIRVKSEKQTQKRLAGVRSLVKIRQALGKLVDAQREGIENEADLRKTLKKLYNAFVKEFGGVNDSDALKYIGHANDPNYASLAALEHNAEPNKEKPPRWIPATIMERSTMRARPRAENLSVRDAYVFQRNESLEIDIPAIANLSKSTEAEVISELVGVDAIYFNPEGKWDHADVYLSGNVRMKLSEARAAKDEGIQGMERNIEALEQVIPDDIPYFNIEAKLGNNWSGVETYRSFIAELLSANEREVSGIDITFGPQGWRVRLGSLNRKPEASAQWGVADYQFDRLIQAAMNNSTISIRKKDFDGKYYVDEKSSAAANEKAQTLREHFGEWLWKDPERRVNQERAYNEVFNSIALPNFDGGFLSFEGMMLERGDQLFNLRSHQSAAIARGLITGRGIYAHEVGTGKTYTMAGIAIESRRYGKARKPLIFAHNANSATVAREINEMYPGAKVLYVDKLDKKSRAVRLAQIINDDWDAIVVPHSMIDKFALRSETYEALAAEEIAELEAAAIDAAEEDGAVLETSDMGDEDAMKKVRSPRAKELVKARNRIIARIEKMSQKSDENAIRLEDAGIDMVIVDEAHEFKKPPIATKMQMRGLNTSASDRSVNMMFLLNYIAGINSGSGVHLFTGTPITNTLNEIYNMMRFTMGDVMKRDGVAHWDAWFNTFADQNTDIEVTATGEYSPVTRLSSFVNVPELRLMVGQYMDTVFADEMPEFEDRKTKSGKTLADTDLTESERRELENGRTENAKGRPYKLVKTVVAEMSPDQQEIRKELMQRARIFANAPKKERRQMMLNGSPNVPIRVETDASNAGLDARLFDTALPDFENSKVNQAVSNVINHYNEHDKACQVIFMERGFGDSSYQTGRDGDGNKTKTRVDRFNLSKNIVEKLTERGVPEEQIAIVDGSVSKERRKQIADAMNSGEIRVVIGSTGTLGTGVNMQKNLRAMHHLDAPWRPGDLEQRNGRGHRQGNQWNSVIEYRYVTEGIDGRRWQVLVVKDKFIKEFLRSNGDKRTIEGDAASMDEGGGNDLTATLSEATGDPRILLMEKAKKDIERLRRRERMHVEGVADARKKITSLTGTIQRREQALSDYQTDSEKVQSQSGDDFSIEIAGKYFSDRKKANQKLTSLHTKLPIKHKQAPKRIGSFKGFEIFGQLNDLTFGKPEVEMYVQGKAKHHFRGSIAGMEAVLRNIPMHIKDLTNAIAEDKRSVENLEKAVLEPFAHGDKLEKSIRALDQIEKDLALNPVPPPAWLRQPTPIGATILHEGQQRTVSGHMWNETGWYVMVEGEEGFDAIPYTEARDEQGADIYEEREFVAPEILEEKKTDPEDDGNEDKFRTMSVEDAVKGRTFDMAADQKSEALDIIRDIFGDKINVEFVTEKLITPDGRAALGKYRQGWITLVKGGQMADTALHEAVHAAADLFLSPEDKAALLADVGGNEESLAENFVKYARDRSGFTAKVKRVAHRLLRILRALVGRPNPPLDRVTKFYDDLLAGALAGNTQQQGSGETSFRAERQAQQKIAEKLQKSENDVIERIGLFLDTKSKDKNARDELKWWQPIVQTISHYKDQVPQIGKLFESASRLSDNKHLRGEEIFGEGEQDLGGLKRFEKIDKVAAKKVKEYLMQRDVDAVGYTVRQNEEGGFDIINPSGQYVTTAPSEDDAWMLAFAKEAQDYKTAGNSVEASETIRTYRIIGHRMYKQLLGSVEELKKNLDEIGAEMPTFEDGTSLFQALSQMGDRRGHYMPRVRKSGQYGLIAKKEGEHPIRQFFVMQSQRKIEAAKLRQQGYSVEFELNERPAEDVYLDLSMMAMNDVLNNAMQRLGDMDQNISLSDFGLESKVVNYETKKDGTEKHLTIKTTDQQSFWADMFKAYGGRRYDDGKTGTGEVWHFVNPPKGFENELAQAMYAHEYGTRQPAIEFGNMMTKQVAEIIHSRGSRSRKIGRNEATGRDVWKGYEEDAFRAMTLAGKSTAGGTAKRQMAKEMMRIVTGTEKSWADFREEYLDTHPEIDEKDWIQMKTVLKKYQDFVKEQRLDSATQPVAFKEANSFMREMLRNEEPIERVVGAIKGVAAFKHLSGIAPGVVNMTALLTTVPASMSHFGNINLKRVPQLLKRGMANYVKHYTHSRWGKGEGVRGEEDQWLFNEISRRGWDEALMNDEAIKSLQSSVQRGWGNVLEKSLIVFSTTERINRGSTIAAAYYGLMEKNPDMSRDEALKQAKEISDKGHGVYGKVNLPSWARGSNVGSQVGRAWYMYKTFSHNYLQVTGEMIRQGDLKSAAFMLVSPAIVGGAGASILTPVLGAVVQGVFSALGLQPPDDPEEEFYLWAADTFGDPAGRFARTGVAGLAGMNLKGSLALDVTDLLPTKTSDLLGAPYSLFEDALKGGSSIARGDVVKGVETLLPRFAASPVRGIREATEGVTSKSNQPLFYGDERVKADWYDALLRSLSFNPAEISIKREKQWNERQVEDRYRDMRTDLYAQIRRFMLNGGGTKAEWADILLDVEKYNARVRQSRFKSIPFVTESGIKSQITKMNTPLKREKIRAGLTEREDPGVVFVNPHEKKASSSVRKIRRSGRRQTRRS